MIMITIIITIINIDVVVVIIIIIINKCKIEMFGNLKFRIRKVEFPLRISVGMSWKDG